MNPAEETITNGGWDSPLAYALSSRDRQIADEIAAAIARGDVLLAYQPVVSAGTTSRIAFWEGLVRIHDRSGRLLPASEFMAVAETSETGRKIDCLALERGLKALSDTPTLRLSVNMSARSVGYPRWVDTLRRGLAADATIADRLILEITEASAMVMPDVVAVFMAEMHRRGISFALDDFGAGFTAFRYLRDFTFDIVKIDGQFVRGIDSNPDNQVLAAALLSIGRHFDMFTVAEAVECEAEAAFLRQAGFDCLQGYHFGAPTIAPEWAKPTRDAGAFSA